MDFVFLLLLERPTHTCYSVLILSIASWLEFMAMASRKRKHLTLENKVQIIKRHKEGRSVKALQHEYQCGQTQIYSIIKQQDDILATYESNSSRSSHSLGHKARNSSFSKVNDSLYDWYRLACSKNIYPDGPVLKEKAIEIADKLGVEGFKASNGWLEKWKKRHFIRRVTVCGESGDVSGPTVDSWKERLAEILHGYELKDIYNIDETGCFWRSLPDKGFGEKGKGVQRGQKVKIKSDCCSHCECYW